MRILLAADDSPGAERARALVASLHLPKDTTIRVIRSLGPLPTGAGLPDSTRDDLIGAALGRVKLEIDAFSKPLRSPGVTVESDALSGRAASAIVENAERWRPDLIVVGSHGRGQVASAVLGSVAAEVIDHAPCPVLVARNATVSRVVAAHDGSNDADAACRLVATGIFKGPVLVVSVAHATGPLLSGVSANVRDEVIAAHRDELARARHEHQGIAEGAARSLQEAGVDATAEVRAGAVGDEILAAASAWGADLIAMGTRGRTGLERLLLGSVARKVLYGAKCSVLVARESAEPR
jgi:nucleotide-binding universal stress UspA family protein